MGADLDFDILAGVPVARVGRRFLPLPAAALLFPPDEAGLVDLPAAPGTPVHAVQAGRVVSAEHVGTGEVTLRVTDEVRAVYRRLLPSSVAVKAGGTVQAGDILAVVAPTAPGTPAGLQFGLQRPDGSWEVAGQVMIGWPDPLELFLKPPETSPTAAPTTRKPGFRTVRAPEPQPKPTSAKKPPPPPPPEPGPKPPPPPEPPSLTPEPPSQADKAAPAVELPQVEPVSKLASRRTRRPRTTSSMPPAPTPPPAEPPVPTDTPPVAPTVEQAANSDTHPPDPEAPATAVEEPSPPDEPSRTEAEPTATERSGQAGRLAGRRRRPGSSPR